MAFAGFLKEEKIDVSIMFKNVGEKKFSPLHFSSIFFVPNCMIKYLPSLQNQNQYLCG
jgi:hypothetical protein